MFHVPEQYRAKVPGVFQKPGAQEGMFVIRSNKVTSTQLFIIASSGMGWEHVSVTVKELSTGKVTRCPTWEEMCVVKGLFWDKTDCVIQYHPSEDQYVNNHPFCLHLWRPVDQAFPIPPKILVGI